MKKDYVNTNQYWHKIKSSISPKKHFVKSSLLLRNGLFDEYQEIKSQPPDGTFDNARLAQNQAKVSFG